MNIRTLGVCGALVLMGAGCTPTVQPNEELEQTIGINEPTPSIPPIPMDNTAPTLASFTTPPSSFPGVLADADRLNRRVTLKTSKGNITVELYGDAAPKAVSNFLVLAKTGFYDSVKFHRVIKGFMIQTGDPQSADDAKMGAWGTGGPGYRFEDELGGKYTTYERGTLAMANSGPNTNGSQFFIMHKDYGLPNSYTVFGKVIEGLDVVDTIAGVATNASDRPLEAVVIKGMKIE